MPAEAAATAARIAAGAPLVARWHKQWIARLLEEIRCRMRMAVEFLIHRRIA